MCRSLTSGISQAAMADLEMDMDRQGSAPSKHLEGNLGDLEEDEDNEETPLSGALKEPPGKRRGMTPRSSPSGAESGGAASVTDAVVEGVETAVETAEHFGNVLLAKLNLNGEDGKVGSF